MQHDTHSDIGSFGKQFRELLNIVVLDTPEEKVTDLIEHHVEKFIEVAKEFFMKAKNTMRLRMLLSPHGVQENLKKSLIHFFMGRSFVVAHQKAPLYIIVHQPAEEETRNFRYSPISRVTNPLESQGSIDVNIVYFEIYSTSLMIIIATIRVLLKMRMTSGLN